MDKKIILQEVGPRRGLSLIVVFQQLSCAYKESYLHIGASSVGAYKGTILFIGDCFIDWCLQEGLPS